MRSREEHLRRFAPGPLRAVGRRCLFAFAFAAFSLTFLAACAARGFMSPDPTTFGAFRIDVTNDRAPRAQIYLLPGAEGAADPTQGTLLGTAPVEGTTTFRVELDDPTASHRLAAILPRNEELLSESFVPADAEGVGWRLGDNRISEVDGSAAAGEGAGLDGASSSRSGDRLLRRPSGSRRIPPPR